MEQKEKEEFILLTKKALGEADPDRFIEVLMERDPYVASLLKSDPGTSDEGTVEYLLYESLILSRLEAERSRVVEKIDKLSKNRIAQGIYTPKFPFPPMPVFLDKKG